MCAHILTHAASFSSIISGWVRHGEKDGCVCTHSVATGINRRLLSKARHPGVPRRLFQRSLLRSCGSAILSTFFIMLCIIHVPRGAAAQLHYSYTSAPFKASPSSSACACSAGAPSSTDSWCFQQLHLCGEVLEVDGDAMTKQLGQAELAVPTQALP